MSEESKIKKSGIILAGFKILLKSTKFLEFALAGASFAAYSYLFNWQFAAMLLLMIFIHETGHVIAMKQCGVKVKGVYLIPFFGGAAVAETEFKTRRDETYIALMGPWFGLIVSIFLYCLYLITKMPVFAVGATWCSLMNLFNLLPVNPLDGGRVVKSLVFSTNGYFGVSFLFLSLIGMIYMIFTYRIWLFLFLLFIAIIEVSLEIFVILKRKQKTELFLKLKNSFNEINVEKLSDKEREKVNLIQIDMEKESKLFAEKPKMSLKQIIIYTILYLLTCCVFLSLMSFTLNLPGCKEAFNVLK